FFYLFRNCFRFFLKIFYGSIQISLLGGFITCFSDDILNTVLLLQKTNVFLIVNIRCVLRNFLRFIGYILFLALLFCEFLKIYFHLFQREITQAGSIIFLFINLNEFILQFLKIALITFAIGSNKIFFTGL